ncbi:fungal specific transcription factor domain-containing protein [Pseudohyphozyma bogoriensis]|nr:fungal specific transcription factor domain-containing protein [Pseudohyphozyma bogoriensis]
MARNRAVCSARLPERLAITRRTLVASSNAAVQLLSEIFMAYIPHDFSLFTMLAEDVKVVRERVEELVRHKLSQSHRGCHCDVLSLSDLSFLNEGPDGTDEGRVAMFMGDLTELDNKTAHWLMASVRVQGVEDRNLVKKMPHSITGQAESPLTPGPSLRAVALLTALFMSFMPSDLALVIPADGPTLQSHMSRFIYDKLEADPFKRTLAFRSREELSSLTGGGILERNGAAQLVRYLSTLLHRHDSGTTLRPLI